MKFFIFFYILEVSLQQPHTMENTVPSSAQNIWYGFDMSSFPPNDIVDKTLSWLFMPIIFFALEKSCPSWSFSRNSLPSQWDNWISTYSNAFKEDFNDLLKFIEENYDTQEKDHLNIEAQEHIIHDRFSQNLDVIFASQELQEWALFQQQKQKRH